MCALCVGCAHQPPRRVAVMPLDSVGMSSVEAKTLERQIRRRIASREDLADVPASWPSAVNAEQACQSVSRPPPRCVRALARRVQADDLLTGQVGRLGQATVLRLQRFAAKEGRNTRVEAVLRGVAKTAQARAIVDHSLRRLFGPAARPPPRWYTRWWVWTIAGVAAVAAVTLPIALRSSDDERSYDIPLP